MGLENESCSCHSRMLVAGIQPYTAMWMPDKLVPAPVFTGINYGGETFGHDIHCTFF